MILINIGIKMKNRYHILKNEWKIDDYTHVEINPIIDYIEKNNVKPKLISFDDISHKKSSKNHNRYEDRRYIECDINYPGILTEGINPDNKKYRMIDGMRRIYKMKDMGMTESKFYIVDFKIVEKNSHKGVTNE